MLVKNVNDDEILEMTEWCGANKFTCFIEVMPIGDLSSKRKNQFLSVDYAKNIIENKYGLIPSNHKTSGPSRYFRSVQLKSTIVYISNYDHLC